MLFNDHIEAPVIIRLIEKKLLRGKVVLDIGCGPGIYTRKLLRTGASVVAIDTSHVMLSSAKKYCSDLGTIEISKSQFFETSFEDASFSENQFDLIIATFMISYFSDLEASFKKMSSYLKAGGSIITSMLHPIRLYATSRNNEGYVVENYFEKRVYKAGFLSKTNLISLNRYKFSDISSAAKAAGMYIEHIFEPKLDNHNNFPDQEKAEFYIHNPSIAIIELRKLKA